MITLEIAIEQIEDDSFFEQLEETELSCYEPALRAILDAVKVQTKDHLSIVSDENMAPDEVDVIMAMTGKKIATIKNIGTKQEQICAELDPNCGA